MSTPTNITPPDLALEISLIPSISPLKEVFQVCLLDVVDLFDANLPRPSVPDADKVETAHHELKEEHEEEDHEVEGGVVAECFVCGPEPTDERDRREEDKVEEPEPEGLAKVAAGKQVEQADYHVREEQTNMR